MSEPSSINPSLFLRPEELGRAADLMFYAHRDFSGIGDELLQVNGLGRAHGRALHFIGRMAGITVGDLLDTLKVTKQSLNKTLHTLDETGMIRTEVGREDRRQRILHLTEKGIALADALEAAQHERIIEAYRSAGPKAIAAFWDILIHLIDPAEQEKIRQKLGLEKLP